MDRRDFLKTLAAAPAMLSAQAAGPFPVGINTYCIRALRWNDAQLLDYAAGLRLDAIFLQDSIDPKAMDPAHWAEVKARATQLGLHLETGGSGILPKSEEDFSRVLEAIRTNIRRAKAMGSPIVRCLWASERAAFPPGPIESHMVVEDLPGRQIPPAFLEAIRFQQRDHLERSVEYAKKTLNLGLRWRY